MLLVVPLAPEDADALTLAEWDQLVARRRVLFTIENHPLMQRLTDHGVEVASVNAAPSAEGDEALVVDPASEWIVELARRGADVTSGPATAPDALTAAHGAYLARTGPRAMGSLALVMARLRSSDGCPWDREQSHASLRMHLIEEAYEVLDAIDRGSLDHELEEELGDLLLQVAFHAQLAWDDGRFDLAGVADAIVTKLIHRHPHVFGDRPVADADEVVRNWEDIKKEEKARTGPFEGIPQGLPALLATYKIQKRAASLGFQPTEAEARTQLDAAMATRFDPGAVLFWLVALCRAVGVDPEGALREETAAFVRRHENS